MQNPVYSHYILRDNTLIGKSEGRRPCGEARPSFDIKSDIKIIGREAVKCIHPAWGTDHRRDTTNVIINLLAP
jgi:hypothetical protein